MKEKTKKDAEKEAREKAIAEAKARAEQVAKEKQELSSQVFKLLHEFEEKNNVRVTHIKLKQSLTEGGFKTTEAVVKIMPL